ncbi:MAG: hypothetical protein Q9159_002202 [Coniocarpon cinnabarinum]
MARLNEPPASAETLEGLKRRFVRQNRDLARSNSNQSVKLRQQELEISHLLSENASLRQRINQLENEISVSFSNDMRSNVDALRLRLETQLRDFTQQVNGTLADLNSLPKKPHRRKSQMAASPKRSPARREWKNSSTLCEVLASQGQTMPTITEDKSFPRRTLGVEDLREMSSTDGLDLRESPELQRPITFLDREDAVIDHGQRWNEMNSPERNADGILGSVEIRKKRRHSSLVTEDQTLQETHDHPLKVGASRKLNIPNARNDRPKSIASPGRPILAEKSINTDPSVSPRKAQPAANKKPGFPKGTQPLVKAASKATPLVTKESQAIYPPVEVVEIKADDDLLIKKEPTTPSAPLSLFSPASTQPSGGDEPKGRPATPPPASDTGSLGRGTRRSRPAVSYAEPKLNVKMRRPGKELADAVAIKRESSVGQDDQSEAGTASQRVIHIKKEPIVGSASAHNEPPTNVLSPSLGREKPKDDLALLNAALDGAPKASHSNERNAHVNGTTGDDESAQNVFDVDMSPLKKIAHLEDPPRKTGLRDPSTSSRVSEHRRASSTSNLTSSMMAQSSSTTSNSTAIESSNGSLRRPRRQTMSTTTDSESTTTAKARPASVASGSVAKELKSVGRMSNAKTSMRNGDANRAGMSAAASNLRAERAARIAERRRSMML